MARTSIFLFSLSVGVVALAAAKAGETRGAAGPFPPRYEVTGITSPQALITLASVREGRISEILVAEGATVRKGDVVFTLDDRVQYARTQIAKAKSESTLSVEHARARWEHAKRELDRLTTLRGDDFASSRELSDALAQAQITRIEYDLAGFERVQTGRAYAYEQRLLEEHTIRAPFGGYVSQRLKHAGETVDRHEGILTLAQLDPLRVSVDCPLGLSPQLKAGDRVEVRPVDAHFEPREGRVELTNRVADGASQTFKVRITVPNADGDWMSGLKVVVVVLVDLAGEDTAP